MLGILTAVNAFGNDTASQKPGRRHHGPPPEAYFACEGKNAEDTIISEGVGNGFSVGCKLRGIGRNHPVLEIYFNFAGDTIGVSQLPPPHQHVRTEVGNSYIF